MKKLRKLGDTKKAKPAPKAPAKQKANTATLGITPRLVAETISEMCGSIDLTAKTLNVTNHAIHYHVRNIKRDKNLSPDHADIFRIYDEATADFKDQILAAYMDEVLVKRNWLAMRYALRHVCKVFDEKPVDEGEDSVLPLPIKVEVEVVDGRRPKPSSETDE